MSWHFLERWLDKANSHSSLVGRYWISFLVVCRLILVSTIGDRVYGDERSEFRCNTMQIGCPNVCFDKFSPISHLRFWGFQILLSASPSIVYVIYSGHLIDAKKRAKLEAEIILEERRKQRKQQQKLRLRNNGNSNDNGNRHVANFVGEAPSQLPVKGWDETSIDLQANKDKTWSARAHRATYFGIVFIRLVVEITFLVMQMQLYGLIVPEVYKCQHWPCPNIVDCYVSRPTEKTIFLHFMLIYTCICILLNVFELKHVVLLGILSRRNNGKLKKLEREEISNMPKVISELDKETMIIGTLSASDDSDYWNMKYMEENEIKARSTVNTGTFSNSGLQCGIKTSLKALNSKSYEMNRYPLTILTAQGNVLQANEEDKTQQDKETQDKEAIGL